MGRAGEDVAASSPGHPFASRLLWGQQPPEKGPGVAGSADYHGLCVKSAVCRWLHQSAGEDAGGRGPRSGGAAAGARAGICTWFNVHMGFGFLSMTARAGVALDPPVDVFVHQSKLYMDGFRSLKEGEAVEFTYKKSAKGLESIRVTGPGWVFCIGNERRPKGKNMQKHRSKGDRCYNCGGLDHHAKECKLPPQPKKCHFCQSINHVVASCPLQAQQAPSPQGKPAYFPEEEEEIHSSAMLPKAQKSSHSGWGLSFCDQKILRSRHQSAEWRKWGKGG